MSIQSCEMLALLSRVLSRRGRWRIRMLCSVVSHKDFCEMRANTRETPFLSIIFICLLLRSSDDFIVKDSRLVMNWHSWNNGNWAKRKEGICPLFLMRFRLLSFRLSRSIRPCSWLRL